MVKPVDQLHQMWPTLYKKQLFFAFNVELMLKKARWFRICSSYLASLLSFNLTSHFFKTIANKKMCLSHVYIPYCTMSEPDCTDLYPVGCVSLEKCFHILLQKEEIQTYTWWARFGAPQIQKPVKAISSKTCFAIKMSTHCNIIADLFIIYFFSFTFYNPQIHLLAANFGTQIFHWSS